MVCRSSYRDRRDDRCCNRHYRSQPALGGKHPATVGRDAPDFHPLPPPRLCPGGDAGRRRGRARGPVRHRHARRGTRRTGQPADADRGAGRDDGQPCRGCCICGADPAGRNNLPRRRTAPDRRDCRQLRGRFRGLLGQSSTGPARCVAVRHYRGCGRDCVWRFHREYCRQLVLHCRHGRRVHTGDLVRHRPDDRTATGQMEPRDGRFRRARGSQ